MPNTLTLATAAMATQVLFVPILALGVFIMPKAAPSLLDFLSENQLWTRVISLLFISMALLLLCEDITRISRPAFGNVPFTTIKLSIAKSTMFIADIVVRAMLVKALARSAIASFLLHCLRFLLLRCFCVNPYIGLRHLLA
jgi:hypothetical protein